MLAYGRRRWASRWLLFGTLFICVNATRSPRRKGKFERAACKASIVELQQQPNFTKNTPMYFLQDATSGLLYNGPENMTVTQLGCEEFCGGWSFYWDAIPRLLTWILPILLLLSNVELSPIDKKRFMTLFHALGDPIDSFWSLIHKIYIWNRLYAIGLAKSPNPEIVKTKLSLRILRSFVEILRTRWHHIGQFLGWEPLRADEEVGTELSRHDRARIIATVLSGFEEISGAKIESEDYYHMITRQLGRLGEDAEDPAKFQEWRRTARVLADARTNEFPRTCLAVLVYVFGLVAAFIPELGGGNTSPPGGRIGSALLLSWLVPLVLVSNTIGTFTSRRACLTIMRQFVWRVTHVSPIEDARPPHSNERAPHLSEDPESQAISSSAGSPLKRQVSALIAPVEATGAIHISHRRRSSSQATDSGEHIELASSVPCIRGVWEETSPLASLEDGDKVGIISESSWNTYFESLQWLGSIYTYRPWKVLYLDIDHRTHAHRKSVTMAGLAFLPILISATGASVIIWYAVPTGWNCRHIWVFGLFVTWVMSAVWTSIIYLRNKKKLSGHKLWLSILKKDACIAVSGISMILFSTAGLFNSCWCWSAFMMRRENAYVPLEAIAAYEENARKIYSVVVGVCLSLQLLLFLGLMAWWRHGIKIVRWTESHRRKEWRYEVRKGLEHSDQSFLLFWYAQSHLDVEVMERKRLFHRYSISHGRAA